MRNEIRDIIHETSGANAADITHWLSDQGNGKMSEGILNIWDSGYRAGEQNGALKAGAAIGIFIAVYSTGKYLWNKYNRKSEKDAIQAAYELGVESGKQEERQQKESEDQDAPENIQSNE